MLYQDILDQIPPNEHQNDIDLTWYHCCDLITRLIGCYLTQKHMEKKPVMISEASVTPGPQNTKAFWQMGSMAWLMSKLIALGWHFKQLSG